MVDIKTYQPSKAPRCEIHHIRRNWHTAEETQEQCKFAACYRIDGTDLCKVHAGKEALAILLEQNK